MNLGKWVSILRLENWDIEILECPTLDTDASCKMLYNDFKAIIYIKSELSEEQKEMSLVHELLHLLHRDSHDIASDHIDEKFSGLYARHHERAIERMSKILYNNLR